MDMVSTIAAFGGLALGVVNLGLMLYRDYFRRAKPVVSVREAHVRAVDRGTCDVEIVVNISSRGGSLYVQEVAFTHSYPVFDPSTYRNWQKVYKSVEYPGYAYLDGPLDEFEEQAKAASLHPVSIPNLRLEDGEHRILTIVDRINIGREPDGYADWPRRGWHLSVSYAGGKLDIPFDFEVHSSNLVNAFSYS